MRGKLKYHDIIGLERHAGKIPYEFIAKQLNYAAQEASYFRLDKVQNIESLHFHLTLCFSTSD